MQLEERMKEYTTENIINICLSGHTSSGKTMLTEAMLFNAKVINKMGDTESGTTASDYRDYEIENQHSMSLSLLNYEWMDKKINLLDAPGQTEFQGELLSAIKVSDVNALVLNATNDIEVGTELSWDYSTNQMELPKLIIINMIDHEQSNFDQLLESLKTRFGRSVFPLMFPINEGENVSEIGDENIKSPELELAIDQKVMVKIIEIDIDKRKVSLSIKQADPDWKDPEEKEANLTRHSSESDSSPKRQKLDGIDESLENILEELKERGIGTT